MLEYSVVLTSALAFATAVFVSFALTPIVKTFAYKIGAIDVPKDARRMHKAPIPRVGGLAIYLGFLVSALIFGNLDNSFKAILLGSVVLVLMGIVDDVMALPAKTKFVGQIAAAMIPIMTDVRISVLTNPFSSEPIHLGWLSIPVTIVWIVGMINAVNFIDGLDGLACGVSSIASLTVFTIALLVSEPYVAIVMAALAGACFGFLPYNMNPAKIFMGDTGSMFLGYILATMSISGLFKLYAIISFIVPFMILGLPIFDTGFAIIRRLLKGQSPFQADRGHIHHRLVDMGFDQKQSVAILYAVSVILGLSAVIFTTSGEMKIAIFAVAVLLCFFFAMNIRKVKKEPQQKKESGENK
ncbi:MAG: undecaprenyl/decaprenyl-phosphate alpha-N-acetylglucosaminyl 1-phosphate transferase [Clostridia bacterium]|nr:undecaprenyl/decaprenyl-phosphate alpha-N-acetylglucosaminyl 1-phosphate transferase [Clostridia bacterium]MBQ2326060.1 undecaprenyl/decaprenyl-phosphate alpha-N-acetylglucosaminyl 1-phosphate transferase [Clostridia bacterium]MBQ5813701.1 undecaprenyl/decaprenyl-phosphate alpha-N-acetylglucosaminyl 1-phosphate transferase [Clostridia bacterium]